MATALTVVPARADAGHDDHRHTSRCAALARSGGATRRALAEAAGRFVLVRGWERLGFARLRDYAVERLGVSARELQDLARVDAALCSLPRVSAALVDGGLSWTKARLLARVATAEDEERWLRVAKALSARALAREVRRMDLGSLEAGVLDARGDDAEGRRETWQVRCTPAAKAKWHQARGLANRVAGRPLAPWECAEAVVAEVLSAHPLETGEAEAISRLPGVVDALPEQKPDAMLGPPRAERRSRFARARGSLDGPEDAFALDARLCEGVAREQRADAALAEALLEVARNRRYRGLGYSTLDAYVRDKLGLSPRRARMLLRLARAAGRVPTLAAAWQSGALSFLRAYALVPVVVAAPAHAERWISRARQVLCLRLEEEVAEAMVEAELDPARFAEDGGLRENGSISESGRAERQAGAQVTASAESSHLMIHGPRDVIRLLRAALCTVRRHLERQSGRCPTPGEAFEAMLDHATAEWMPRQTRRLRRAQRVYERDGWRCTAPACSSHRSLQDHHIVFRSHGGSDALANRTTLCAWHHLRGVHAGRMRCSGMAPDGLRFELGIREGRKPLLVYARVTSCRGGK